MATPPDPDSPAPRRTGGRSWSSLVAQARRAEAPRVETSHAVWAAIAAEAKADVGVRSPAEETDDGWAVFARMFATPRLMWSSAAGMCVAAPLVLWVLSAGVARMDAFGKFLVYGGLPGWLVAIVA